MKYRAVFFDLDGTFLDTAPDFVTATQQLAERLGHQQVIDTQRVRNAVTHGSKGILQDIFAIDEHSTDFADIKSTFLELYYRCLADNTQPFPGITALLETLDQQGTPWGIVTNKPERFTHAIFERLPLNSTPATLVCPDHVTHTKPHPEPILLACSQVGCNASDTVYIGDHIRDIQAGQAAGADTIAAAYGYIGGDENPADWGANHIVSHASEITQFLF